MLKRFMSLFNSGMKAYKVQDAKRELRVGITAKCLADIMKKGKQKLKIPENEDVTIVIEDDGTVVDSDSFLKTLPEQTVLVFLRKGQNWRGAGDMVYLALNKLYDMNRKEEIAEQIRDMMSKDLAPEKINMMSVYLDMLETDIESEFRYEQEDWFEGLNKKYKTKSEVMRNTAQSRLRSYYTSAKDQIEKDKEISQNPQRKALLSEMLDYLYTHLKQTDFHGEFFDRTSTGKSRMCDKKGWFRCEGPFDEELCSKLHTINPYASRGYRQMFTMWNLDHIIEKSREIIPTVIAASGNVPKQASLNWEEVYRLLFTRDNLRLVHLSCHKKAARLEHTVEMECFIKC